MIGDCHHTQRVISAINITHQEWTHMFNIFAYTLVMFLEPRMWFDSDSSWFSQIFLAALSFAYFAKALSGSYMKSTITQLERRFDIPSYLIGIIDGSFEIGECAFLCQFPRMHHSDTVLTTRAWDAARPRVAKGKSSLTMKPLPYLKRDRDVPRGMVTKFTLLSLF